MRQLPDAGAKRCRSRWGRVRRDCRRVWPANVTTRLLTNKITRLVESDLIHFDVETSSSGRVYFIHMGETPRGDARPCFHVRSAPGASDQQERMCDVSTGGAVSAGGMIRGTYIHGLFDRAGFR